MITAHRILELSLVSISNCLLQQKPILKSLISQKKLKNNVLVLGYLLYDVSGH